MSGRRLTRKSFALLYGFFIVFIVATISASAQQHTRPQVDDDKIAINLRGIDGKTYSLAAMRDQVVLVSFGATWCLPCATELAALEELKIEYREKPVKFLWVSIEHEREATNGALKKYAKSQNLTIPVLRDPEQAAFAQFTTRVRIPLVAFFDKTGRFVGPAYIGMAAPEEYKNRIRSKLDELLNGPSVTKTSSLNR